MTRYWVVALIVAVVGLLFILRRIARRTEADDANTSAPRGDGERELVEWDRDAHTEHVGDDDVHRGDRDDTAPAVLSPAEWASPKSTSNKTRR